MLKKIIYLSIYTLVIVFACVYLMPAYKSNDGTELPLREVRINIKENQLNVFFETMKNFSEHNNFAIRIAPTTPTNEDFTVEMRREDFKILGANPFNKGEFIIGFYNTLGRDIEGKYIDELVESLREYSKQIEGSNFTVK